MALVCVVSSTAYAQTDSVEDLINGRSAGVQVINEDGAPGSAFSVRIRGLRSFRGDNEPLYIVDGVLLNSPMSDVSKTFWSDGQDYQAAQNTLDNINPEDIADIKILKDAAAIAIYGSLGANGVVIITTKKGNHEGFKVNVKTAVGLNDCGRINHKHHVSVEGGSSKSSYYVSAGYRKTNGTLRKSDVELATVDASYEQLFGHGSKFGASLSLGMRNNNMVMATSPLGTNSTIKAAWAVSPNPNESQETWINAYDDNSRQYSVLPHLYVDAFLGAGFKFHANAGADFRNKTRIRFVGSELERAKEIQGLAGQSSGNTIRYNVDADFSYNLNQNRHKLEVLAGAQFNGNIFNEYIYEGHTFFNENLRGAGISIAENVAPYRHVENNNMSIALLAKAEYSFAGRYFIYTSVRSENQLIYDKAFDWKTTYPSFSIGWDIAKEEFMKGQNAVNTLKITAGWGKSGAQQTLPYGYDEYYTSGTAPTFFDGSLSNYWDMRWTNVADQCNVGIDLAFLNSRIVANVNAYYTKSKDELAYYYHTPSTAYEKIYSNNAEVLNKGIEFSVQSDLVKVKNLVWNLGVKFAYNHNEILSNGSDAPVLGNSVGTWAGQDIVTNANVSGYSVGSFYGYKSQGTVQKEHTLMAPAFFGKRLKEGDVKFIDVNNDGNVDEKDLTVIGNSLPKHLLSFDTGLTWKGLSVYAAFDGAFGHQVANLQKFYSDSSLKLAEATGVDVFCNRILEDASYLRLSKLSASYRIDLPKVKWMESITISLSCRNLVTFTGYSGSSPYVNSYGYDLSRAGVDNGAYPSYRSFLLGLTLRF